MPRLKGRHSEWLGPLGQRLAAGSVAIALGSIVLLGGLTLLLADSDLTSAGHEREAASTKAIVNSVRSTYLADPDWQPIDLASAEDLVRAIGVGVELRANGRLLMQVAPPAAGGSSRTVPVVASGRTVATAIITFPSSGVLPEEIAFRRSIEKSVALAAGLALLVALGAAVLGSRRLVAPLRSLTLATRQLAAGDRASRVGGLRASGELAELATAFDGMADKLEREDALRRALVADLAHELRTPLAVLQAQLEGLAVGLLSLDQTAVASLAEEVGQLSRLIGRRPVPAQRAGRSGPSRVQCNCPTHPPFRRERGRPVGEAGRSRGGRRPRSSRTSGRELALQRREVHPAGGKGKNLS